MNCYDVLFSSTRKLSRSLSALVSRYAVAKGVAVGFATPEIAVDDFFFFCIAKGSKHIRAALSLVENKFPEDAIVLSRSAYECYVCAAYAKGKGIRGMDYLVYNPIGLSAGTVEFVRNRKGDPNYRILIDRETRTIYDAAPTIERMASGTGNPDDAAMHRHFYRFASEHVHVNMIGSGNYRNGSRYTDRGTWQSPNAIFFIAYATVILGSLAVSNADADGDAKATIESDIRVAAQNIQAVLNLARSESSADFDAAVDARIRMYLGNGA